MTDVEIYNKLREMNEIIGRLLMRLPSREWRAHKYIGQELSDIISELARRIEETEARKD